MQNGGENLPKPVPEDAWRKTRESQKSDDSTMVLLDFLVPVGFKMRRKSIWEHVSKENRSEEALGSKFFKILVVYGNPLGSRKLYKIILKREQFLGGLLRGVLKRPRTSQTSISGPIPSLKPSLRKLRFLCLSRQTAEGRSGFRNIYIYIYTWGVHSGSRLYIVLRECKADLSKLELRFPSFGFWAVELALSFKAS